MQVGTMVQDRVYGADTPFRLGIIVKVQRELNSVLVRWIVGDGARFNYYYPDNLEIVCK